MNDAQIEHWHGQMDLLVKDMVENPVHGKKRNQYMMALEDISNLRISLRCLHSDWSKSEPYRRQQILEEERRQQNELATSKHS